MPISKWPEKYQTVFNAFQAVLPADKVNSIKRKLSSKKYREEQFKLYAEPVVQQLEANAKAYLLAYFTQPTEHLIAANISNDSYAAINQIASVFSGVYCEFYPSENTAKAIRTRFVNMLEHPNKGLEKEASYGTSTRYFNELYYYPKANVCMKVLLKHWHIEGIKDLLLSVYQGVYNQHIDHGEDEYQRYENTNASFLGYEQEGFNDLVLALFQQNEFEYDWFHGAIRLYPHCACSEWAFPDAEDEESDEHAAFTKQHGDFLIIYRDYYSRVVKDLLQNLSDNIEILKDILDYCRLRGMEWLKLGLEIIVREQLKAKDLKDDYEDLSSVLHKLLGIFSLAEDETEEQLLAMLSSFKEKELLLALPYAGCARNAILKALGWESLVDLQKQIFNIAGSHANTVEDVEDIYNCEDSHSGVIDRGFLVEILQKSDTKQTVKYFKALRASSLGLTNILMLIAAVADIERDKVEKKLVRHGQGAIKAYGLYPVENEEELRQRYLKFKAMHKEATQYGSERQSNTQAAVKAGIKNLAQAAGYSDDIRLEWAMEADIATSMIVFDEDFDIETWQVRLVLEGISPRIQVRKQGKHLKSVPTKVRQHDIYKQMREDQDSIRSQASRFRKTLEDMMCNADVIPADELATLCRLPVVRAMLSQLILKTGDQDFGLFAGTAEYLKAIDGSQLAISGELKIAHVFDLFNAGILPQWQKTVVQRRMVQPFKQAFRELYIVTPAEVDAETQSRRFTGHIIDGATASRLLQSRGWSQNSGDCAEVYKRFPQYKMYAEIGFPDAGHYLAEQESVVIDEIWFQCGNDSLKLEDIDPLVFSEVMRDVDLIASVAQVGDDDARWSTETAQRRAELIENLVAEIGLQQVRCENHYAYIEGKLANYRIHLGSGVIHIQPGNYLCIVPKHDKKDDGLYLPFADTDLRMAEILSKIFLLISDDKITDKSILAQINSNN